MVGSYYLEAAAPSASGQLGIWKPTTSYPTYAQNFSCVATGGYAYCVGGYNGTTPSNGKGDLNNTYFVALSQTGVGDWARTTDYPIGIQDETCVSSSNYIYCVGGYAGSPNGHNIADVYYAPLTASGIGQWTQSISFPYPVPDPRCLTDSGYIYCISAHYNGTFGFTNAGDSYFAQLSSNGVGTWTASQSMPSMTAGCSGSGGHIYCFGGGNCPPPGDCSSPSYFASLSSNGITAWRSTSSLPTAVWTKYLAADSFVYYFSVPVFFAPVSSDGIGPWATTTNYPDSIYPAECVPSGAYIYCVGGSTASGQNTNAVYYTELGVPNPSAFQPQNPPPFQNAIYLVSAKSASGGCSVTVNETFAGVPCFDRNINNAVVFNCAAAAATPSGCKTTVVSPLNLSYNYDVTVWYPYANSPPNANCALLPSLGYKLPLYAWCISTGTDSFIVSQSGIR